MAPRRRQDDPLASQPADVVASNTTTTTTFQQQQGPQVSSDNESEELVTRNEEVSLKEKILQRLRDAIASGRRHRIRLSGLTITVLILIGYYRSRRKRGKEQIRLLSSLSLLWKLLTKRPDHESAMEAPLSHLLRAADQGLIQRALIGSSVVYYSLSPSSDGSNSSSSSEWRRSTLPHGNPQLHSDVLEKLSSNSSNNSTQVSALGESLGSRMSTPIIAALPFVYLGLLYRMMKNIHGGGDMQLSSSSGDSDERRTTFADVAGLDSVVEQVYDVVSYLKDPDRYAAVGARPPRGILLHGPPGLGKTLLARAVAGEAQVDAFLSCSASEFVELYVGRGAARVRSLFAQARQQARTGAKRQEWWNRLLKMIGLNSDDSVRQSSALARKKTAILFIDELDALAKTRASWNSNDEREQTLNQLLTEMDGFATAGKNGDDDNNVTLIVMAASNRADVIDPAVLRRFDRQIHVGYPDRAGRKSILQIHAQRVRCTQDGTIDWDALAVASDGFSGADLRNAANEAALVAVREGSQTVDYAHLRDAIQRISQMKETVKRRPYNTPPSFYKVELN